MVIYDDDDDDDYNIIRPTCRTAHSIYMMIASEDAKNKIK